MTALHINRAKEAHKAEGAAMTAGNEAAAKAAHKEEGKELDEAAKAARAEKKKLNSFGVFTDKAKAEAKAKECGGKVVSKEVKARETKSGRKIKAKTVYIIQK